MPPNYQPAPMAKRVTAFIIDMIIVGMVTSAFLFVSMGKTPEKLQASGDEGKPSLMDKYQFFAYFEPIALDPNRGIYLENFLKKYKMESAVGLFLLPLLYFVLLEGMKGATIGKMMTGIRVRRKDIQKEFIKSYLKPTLKEHGYKTSAQTWWKNMGDFFIVINLQNSSLNSKEELSFCLNIGVALTEKLADKKKQKAT